jgi:hypothetical protein
MRRFDATRTRTQVQGGKDKLKRMNDKKQRLRLWGKNKRSRLGCKEGEGVDILGTQLHQFRQQSYQRRMKFNGLHVYFVPIRRKAGIFLIRLQVGEPRVNIHAGTGLG